MQKFVHKRTKAGTILVVADALRPLAPPVVYTGLGCKQRCQLLQIRLLRATKWSPVIINQGEGEFCEEILTRNLRFNGLIETQYLKARFFH